MPESRDSSIVIGPALEGVGYVISAPARLPLVRTVLKEMIKVGLRTSHAVQGFANEQGRHWQELLAEAQMETSEARQGSSIEAAPTRTSTAAARKQDELQTLKGVTPQTAELLRSAGIRSPRSLARRNPDKLHAKLQQINEQESLVDDVPSVEQIQGWMDRVTSKEA